MKYEMEIPETLYGLVNHYGPSGQEQAAVNYLQQRMLTLGFQDVYQDEAGNAIGSFGDGPKTLVLLGHIDTVPGEIKIRQEGDKFFGRGTVDAKGPLAAFTDAAAAVGANPGWKVVVIGAVDEERDSVGARFLVNRFQPQMVVIGEPSDWQRVTLGYKGSAFVEVLVRLPLKHSAGQGETASEKLFALWQEIQERVSEFNQARSKVFEQLQISLRCLASEEDGFEEMARMKINARLPLDFSFEDWYGLLGKVCSERGEVTPIGYPVNAYRSEKNNPLVRAFLNSIRQNGGKPGFVLKTGTADMNIVGPVWNCPILAYGPGDSSLDHTPDEHILTPDYWQAVRVLEGVIREITSE